MPPLPPPIPVMVGRVRVSELRPSPIRRHRRTIREESLRQLADSIERHGLLVDLLVRPIGAKASWDGRCWKNVDYFEIVLGERRWRAAKLAGLSFVGVKVMILTDDEVRAIQREDAAHKHGYRATVKHERPARRLAVPSLFAEVP